MIKRCRVCNHTGELTWRDGKYHCAMCDSVISETEPEVAVPHTTPAGAAPHTAPRQASVVNNATCPICKNTANNLFDGFKYRCSLCGTSFDVPVSQSTYESSYTPSNTNSFIHEQKVKELQQQREKNLIIAIVLLVLFWPAAIYFFYKFYQLGKEISALS